MATTAQTNAKIIQFIKDVEIAHQIIHGGPAVTVPTDGGVVRSFANVVGQLEADVNAAADSVLAQVLSARDLAVSSAESADQDASDANLSKLAAASSQTAAATSAAAAGASQTAAATSATNAAGSATAAGNSQTAAAASQAAAGNSATAAAGSATAASTANTEAQAARTQAVNSATSATGSQTAAATSASAASASETNAATSKTAAATSQTAAANSATAAAGSATAAAASAQSAASSADDAEWSASVALNAPGTSATSTTSLAIGTGARSLVLAQTGKAFVVGQWVYLVDSSSPASRWMHGTVTAFTPGTGAMTVNVVRIGGSGTFASWLAMPATPDYETITALADGSISLAGGATIGTFLTVTGTVPQIKLQDSDGADFWLRADGGVFSVLVDRTSDGTAEAANPLELNSATNTGLLFGNTIWHSGNDGAGSGLDADLLDGQSAAYYSDIPARLGFTPLNATAYTAADVLAKLLTVDGASSGLDADLLDGMNSSAFAAAAHTHSSLSVGAATDANADRGVALSYFTNTTGSTNFPAAGGLTLELRRGSGNSSASGTSQLFTTSNGVEDWYVRKVTGYSSGDTWGAWRKLWHDGNMGAGSGLNADLLDGVQASSFALLSQDAAFDDLTVTGSTILGDGAGDTVTINGTAVSIPNGLSVNGGNFGIGSAADAVMRLRVAANNPTRGFVATIRNDASASQTGAQFMITQNAIADWAIGQPAGVSAFAFWRGRNTSSDGTEVARFDASNNFGLGTNTPGARLHVAAAADGTVAYFTSTSNARSGRVSLDANGTWFGNNATLTGEGVYYQASINALRLYTASTERARLDATGNALVNTTTGVASGRGLAIFDASVARIQLRNTTTGDAATDGSGMFVSGSDFGIENREAGSILMYTNGSQRVSVSPAGNVGVGAVSAGPRLDVYGSGSALAIRALSGDHSYFSIYPRTADTSIRGAYLGFAAAAVTDLTVMNELAGGLEFGTNAVIRAQFNSAGHFTPELNNTYNIGASGARWATVYATTFDGALTGNASTATALQTARTINGVSFDGTANITVTAAAANALTIGSYLTGSSYNGSGAVTIAVDATSGNTASKVVARDAGGNFTAGTITAALSGNATTATTLQTSRNINGVAFNGSADITVAAAAGSLTGTGLANGVTSSSLTSVGTLTALTVSGAVQFTASTASTSTTTGALRVTGGVGVGGAIYAGGTVSGTSDERLKRNWRGLGGDFVGRLAGVRSGIYDRTDIEETMVGVSAQSLREVLPHAVLGAANDDSYLSVAYGNAALVAAVELAREVVALRRRVASLEAA